MVSRDIGWSCEGRSLRIRTEHLASSSYLNAEVPAAETMSSSSADIAEDLRGARLDNGRGDVPAYR